MPIVEMMHVFLNWVNSLTNHNFSEHKIKESAARMKTGSDAACGSGGKSEGKTGDSSDAI